jgi:hypothetical protein
MGSKFAGVRAIDEVATCGATWSLARTPILRSEGANDASCAGIAAQGWSVALGSVSGGLFTPLDPRARRVPWGVSDPRIKPYYWPYYRPGSDQTLLLALLQARLVGSEPAQTDLNKFRQPRYFWIMGGLR